MFPAIRYPEDLPITARRGEIVAALRAHPVVIVAGETGSGKTTQLPKMCLEAGLDRHGQIGCTQPRRVAALSISRRVAEELGVTWGREVGCKIRFDDRTAGRDTTRVKFMTDGILLAEVQSDPGLRAYSTLIIDEAHERSLNIDFLLGHLRGLRRRRPDLKLVITSATIDTAAFSRAFDDAPVIEVSGRMFPVETRYAPVEGFVKPGENAGDVTFIEAALRATEDALIESDAGDVLVFLPTERDIRETCDLLEGSLGKGVEILGLFGRMPAGEQTRIFAPGPRRRVIVATNIAETSLTIPRIRFVIDAGLARVSRYNPRTRTRRLPVEVVSQSSANQRAGRAGRVQDGICVRLYDPEDFEKRPPFTQPELQRANLAEVILRMKAFRLGEIETFPFLDPPAPPAIHAGYALLHELGALDDAHALTAVGRELARLPLDPTLGRMLLQAREENALPETLVIAAGLSVPDPRERPEDAKEAAAAAHRAFVDADSDFLSLLNLWRAAPDVDAPATSRNALRRFCKANYLSLTRMREWRDIYRQLEEAMRERTPTGSPGERRHVARSPNTVIPSEAEGPRKLPASADSGVSELRGRSLGFARDDSSGGGRRQGAVKPDTASTSSYASIHRSVLAGLLGQIAQRQERNLFLATGNRQATLFPGSGLYERREKPKKGRDRDVGANLKSEIPGPGSHQPPWIVAAEIVQTSQLFARTVARIDPAWVAELGAHLCKFSYSDPHWNVKSARVLAWERVLLGGLEVVKRRVDYGNVDAVKATELFIRGALVAGEASVTQRFFEHNRKLREKVETALTRVRNRRVEDLDEAFYRFYAARVESVSSVHDLNRLVRDRLAREPDFLCATEEDLLGNREDDPLAFDRTLFPDQVPLGNTALPLTYAYAPGQEEDGVTVRVPLPVAEGLSTGQLQWLVPGLRVEQISVLLRALPKGVRKGLMPLEPKVREIAGEFRPGSGEFLPALAGFLSKKYGVEVRAEDWPPDSLPAYLNPRVEVVDGNARTVAAGRDLVAIRASLESRDVRSDAWDRAARRWERRGVPGWTFGDLPETVQVETVGGVPLLAFPGLARRGDDVDVQLFRRREEAEAASPAGVRRLAEVALARDVAWLHKELGGLARRAASAAAPGLPGKPAPDFRQTLDGLAAALAVPRPGGGKKAAVGAPPNPAATAAAWGAPETLQASALEHVLAATLRLDPVFPLSEARFKLLVETARRELPAVARRVEDLTRQIFALRRRIVSGAKRYPGWEHDLRRLLPPDFLARTPPGQLGHLPRYLRAMETRAERAAVNPAKDAEKARALAPFTGRETRVPAERQEAFRWLLEEFRVSLFAQELGTAQPVSAARLQAMAEGPEASAPPPARR